ncbi:hypothetical protein [Desulfovibrio ferrophilus]|nr:hypothetical protein [Desulfovibrio ferrophilus]
MDRQEIEHNGIKWQRESEMRWRTAFGEVSTLGQGRWYYFHVDESRPIGPFSSPDPAIRYASPFLAEKKRPDDLTDATRAQAEDEA